MRPSFLRWSDLLILMISINLILFLQTVYAQLRQRSAAAHRRAHERVFMNEHAWFLFDDEHHPDVYVEKDEVGRILLCFCENLKFDRWLKRRQIEMRVYCDGRLSSINGI